MRQTLVRGHMCPIEFARLLLLMHVAVLLEAVLDSVSMTMTLDSSMYSKKLIAWSAMSSLSAEQSIASDAISDGGTMKKSLVGVCKKGCCLNRRKK